MKYLGIFKEINDLKIEGMLVNDIYHGFFADFYESMCSQTKNEELDIYLKNAFITEGNVLELACGTGRMTFQLARRGINVIGVDNSSDMLSILDKKLQKSSIKIRKKIKWYKQDVFNLDIKEKFSLVIIPATTICLLVDDIEKTICMFNYLYDKLPYDGRLVFDYICEYKYKENITPTKIFTNEMDGTKQFVLFQEFRNVIPGRAILNLYVEKIKNNNTYRYLASTDKKIMSDKLVDELISKTKFKKIEILNVEEEMFANVKYIVLKK